MPLHILKYTFIGLFFVAGVSAAETGDLKHPDWHPDGRFLVAEGSCAGSIDLYAIDLESGSVQLVWDGGFTEGYPRWLSDGERIAFHQINDKRESRLFLADLSLNGRVSEVRRISEGPFDIEPAPSPNGNLLVYSQQGEKGLDIALIDLAGGGVSRVWKTEFAENFPSWHPDGDAIIFYARKPSGTQLYIRSLSSDRIDALTTGDGPNFVGTLSPDGSLLAYSSERTGDREIYLRDVLGGEERRLTEREGRDGYAKFSPDGLKLAYHSVIDGTDGPYVVIRLMDLDTGATTGFSCRDWSTGR